MFRDINALCFTLRISEHDRKPFLGLPSYLGNISDPEQRDLKVSARFPRTKA